MLFYVTFLLTTCILASVSAKGVQFIDCPGNDGGLQLLTRRCCISSQLPKDCECYDISIQSDYRNSVFRKPDCPNKINVKFNLYTRDQDTNPEIITEDMNVVIVDWEQGARGPFYFHAVANTRVVGSMVARLIQDMNKYTQAAYKDFHLIGHSLGAQIMGYAGKEVFRLTNRKVGRISGLDPAGPNFEGFSKFVRIDSTDAQFVDIIHTDAPNLLLLGLGMKSSVGHVDFYPNGGVHQPGCPTKIKLVIQTLTSLEGVACSHVRAVEYFTNSIQKCRYNPPDGNTACTMGYHVSRSCRGKVYPITTATAPYCH